MKNCAPATGANTRLIGMAMLSTPLLAFALSTLMGHLEKYVFAFETVGVWAFAYYWWTKSRELARSGAELLAVQGKMGA